MLRQRRCIEVSTRAPPGICEVRDGRCWMGRWKVEMPPGRDATPGQYADGTTASHLLELRSSSIPGDGRILPRRRWARVHAGAAAVRERGIDPLGYQSAPLYPSR